MPTHDETEAFCRDFDKLTAVQRIRFLRALERFIANLQAIEAGRSDGFRRSLRVKGVRGSPGVFEMTWAPDGRATFSWGTPAVEGHRHVQWRRCGTHDILRNP